LSGKSLNQDTEKLKLNSSCQELNDNDELIDLYVKADWRYPYLGCVQHRSC